MTKYLYRILIIVALMLVIAPAVVVALLATGCADILMPSEYIVEDYRKCVGIRQPGQLSYNWVVSKYGEPDSIEAEQPYEQFEHYLIYITCDNLRFMFVADGKDELEDTSLWELTDITTSDPKHYFGKSKIHVGSSREEVIKAYEPAIAAPDRELGERYVDGDIEDFVDFTYDENDIVTSISFGSWM